MADPTAAPTAAAPKAPAIGIKELAWQFRHDIFGKEVQDATTYSYVWLADQMGHICIGIVLTALIGALLHLLAGSLLIAGPVAFVLTAAGVAGWEYWAFTDAVKKATGRFPLDQKLLMENAIVATAYMVLGAALGLAILLGDHLGLEIGFVVVVLGFLAAPYWLKQKIVWQKAALPYLARLADARKTISDADAKTVQAMIDAGAPPQVPPRQVVLAGPTGSGRTSLSIGIGTEHGFRNRSVRYVSFDELLEFAAASRSDPKMPYGDDPGPPNILYWPWSAAQVLIIDDIGPVVENLPGDDGPTTLKALLKDGLAKIRLELKLRDTIWVLGDPGTDAAMHAYAKAIGDFCEGAAPPTVIQLSTANEAIPSTPPPPAPPAPTPAPAPAAAAPATPPVASSPPAAATAPAAPAVPETTAAAPAAAADPPHEPSHPHHHHKS
jgi:hypothetical protein